MLQLHFNKGLPFCILFPKPLYTIETNYYYEKTILNDIIGIVNEEGVRVVEYNYDAFGNITNIIDNSGTNLGNINSYKYKDYYYDLETGYYYLNSRYYNPELRRFINADDTDVLDVDQGTVLEHNLYAYALNNPVNMVDDSGEIAWWVAPAIGGALFDTTLYVIGQLATGQKITAGGLFKSAVGGAVSGVALGGIGKGIAKGIKGIKALIHSKKAAATAKMTVYISKNSKGVVQYVGITNNFARRSAEHLAKKGIPINKLLTGLSPSDARAVEQCLIEIHNLPKNGGTLINKINSIAKSNNSYAKSLKRGYELLRQIGYK